MKISDSENHTIANFLIFNCAYYLSTNMHNAYIPESFKAAALYINNLEHSILQAMSAILD